MILHLSPWAPRIVASVLPALVCAWLTFADPGLGRHPRMFLSLTMLGGSCLVLAWRSLRRPHIVLGADTLMCRGPWPWSGERVGGEDDVPENRFHGLSQFRAFEVRWRSIVLITRFGRCFTVSLMGLRREDREALVPALRQRLEAIHDADMTCDGRTWSFPEPGR